MSDWDLPVHRFIGRCLFSCIILLNKKLNAVTFELDVVQVVYYQSGCTRSCLAGYHDLSNRNFCIIQRSANQTFSNIKSSTENCNKYSSHHRFVSESQSGSLLSFNTWTRRNEISSLILMKTFAPLPLAVVDGCIFYRNLGTFRVSGCCKSNRLCGFSTTICSITVQMHTVYRLAQVKVDRQANNPGCSHHLILKRLFSRSLEWLDGHHVVCISSVISLDHVALWDELCCNKADY